MSIQKIFTKIHKTNKKAGQLMSLSVSSAGIFCSSCMAGLPVWTFGAVKAATGSEKADTTVINVAKLWVNVNNSLIDNVLPKKDWRINLPDDLDPNKKYLLVCNHQSWVDTSIIQYVSHSKQIKQSLPLTRFFTKFELIYIPVIGQAFYFLDFPMMRRHSKKQIKKNPELKGKDIIEAERACKLLKSKPFTLLSYLEGTRFSKSKHQYQKSPYKHLLKPKAGGLSLAISALGEEVDGILDMTIVYPDFVDKQPEYNDLWKGNIDKLSVDIRYLEMPPELLEKVKSGCYHTDEETKTNMFAWLDKLWQEKDKRIEQMLTQFKN